MDTELRVVAGSPGNRHETKVQFSGTLTATAAVAAAKRAFGHANGVTVTDTRTGEMFLCLNDEAKKV